MNERWFWAFLGLLLVPKLVLGDETFTIQERFGVNHPLQVIDFDLATPTTFGRVIGPDGITEVAAQFLEGGKKVAVQTDLPMHATRSWRVTSGPSTAAAINPVLVTTQSAYYEITNGLTGVRITRPGADAQNRLAPIQGIWLRPGVWAATGPNQLQSPDNGQVLAAVSMTTELLERGPLKVVAQVTYHYNRPFWSYGPNFQVPAGPGTYVSTISIEAGRPSILIEDDTDTEIQYRLNVYEAVQPTQGRYRGHHASRVEWGRQPDGHVYAPNHARPPMDATRDLDYSKPYYSDFMASESPQRGTIPRILAWDPWAADTGWYWMLYNAWAGSAAPVVGAFAGATARAIGAKVTGPGVYILPDDGTGSRAAGFEYRSRFLSPDQMLATRMRMSWGLFTGTKGTDLGDPRQVQNIAREKNVRSGINLNKVHRYAGDFSDPPQGFGSLFMERAALDRMISRLRADPQFYTYLYNAEPYARGLIDMWVDPSKRTAVISQVTELARSFLDALVNGDGIYDFHYQYWMGSSQLYSKGVYIDSLLADSGLSPADRARIKACAGLFAGVIWDDDYVPMRFDLHMLNAGTENMPIQHQGYRNFYALFLPTHPVLAPHVAGIRGETMDAVRRIIAVDGSEIGSSHYIGGSFLPVSGQLLQLRMLGGQDPYAEEPRLARFAEFYMQLMSPPEVRFGGARKIIAVGDASTEGSSIPGVLSTGFRTANPGLSARLAGAWGQLGRGQSSFPGTSVVQIDPNAPDEDPALQSASFPGWLAVHRHGWGTPFETAFWLIAGDFYRDHRPDDRGSIVGYALGAPLSISWGGLYAPHTPWGTMHSLVMPTSAFPEWSQDSPPLDRHSGWTASRQDAFAAFSESAFAQGTMTRSGLTWTRRLYSLHHVDASPVIVLRDDFAGVDAGVDKVWSLNLMAQGAVATPAGSVTPPTRLMTAVTGDPNPRPSASSIVTLAPGVHRFGFAGQPWPRHATGGIDWDLYEVSSEPHQAILSNWGHSWHPSVEQSEFSAANGRAFTEAQHILRIKARSSFYVLILPWPKGQKPAGLSVSQQGGDVVVSLGGASTVRLNPDMSLFQDAARTVLASYGASFVSGGGYAIEGGPTEVVSTGDSQLVLSAHGAAGDRILTMPGTWPETSGFTRLPDGRWRLQYGGGAPLRITLQPIAGSGAPPAAPSNLRVTP